MWFRSHKRCYQVHSNPHCFWNSSFSEILHFFSLQTMAFCISSFRPVSLHQNPTKDPWPMYANHLRLLERKRAAYLFKAPLQVRAHLQGTYSWMIQIFFFCCEVAFLDHELLYSNIKMSWPNFWIYIDDCVLTCVFWWWELTIDLLCGCWSKNMY